MSGISNISTGDYFKSLSLSELKRAPTTKKAPFARNGSPYKPLLICGIIVAYEVNDNRFSSGFVYYHDCKNLLAEIYESLGIRFSADLQAPLVQPFWYLGGNSPAFWTFVPKRSQQQKLVTARGRQIKTESALLGITECAIVNSGWHAMLKDKNLNAAMRNHLLVEHFLDAEGGPKAVMDAVQNVFQ